MAKDQTEASLSSYIWFNNKSKPLYIDGGSKSSYGPMANDPLDDERCNAKIYQVGNSDRVVLIPTCDIKCGDEIFVSYGKEYWSDQPHCDLDVLRAAQSYYADASDTVKEVITPFTIASKFQNSTPLSATANEWYPDSPQSTTPDDDAQSIDSQELVF